MKLVFWSFIGLGLAVAPALRAEPIAQVTAVQGKVLLNHGEGFRTVEKMATIDVGDQVLVSKNSAISLQYTSANCQSVFQDPTLLTVSSSAPCATQAGSTKSGFHGGGGSALSGVGQRSSTPISIPSLGGGTTAVAPTATPTAVSLP